MLLGKKSQLTATAPTWTIHPRTLPLSRRSFCAWLSRAVECGASDLHLIVGYPPVLRLHGDLMELTEPPLAADETQQMLSALCPPDVLAKLESQKNVDFSFGVVLNGRIYRFRANLFHAARQIGGCLRVVPTAIPELQWAQFPLALAQQLAFLRDGLVIVTGATGSGKTTTLAMIVNLVNRTGGYRIITVEEPVEYVFPRMANSVVTQREVGRDVLTFADGLKYGLRQDPDVILVGEIRDKDTAQMALSAAETGHLVFTTLHTRDVKGTITRYADLFPQEAAKGSSRPAGDEPAVNHQPAAASLHPKGSQATPRPGGAVEHLSDCQRHPHRQGGKHRQLSRHQP